MKYFEFGQEHSELMVMLHGSGVSYLGMLPTAQKLAERYRVVLVAYDGFNPSEPETEFVSPMDEIITTCSIKFATRKGLPECWKRLLRQEDYPTRLLRRHRNGKQLRNF